MKLKIYENKVEIDQFRYLLSNFTEDIRIPMNPSWIDKISYTKIYKFIYGLKKFRKMQPFVEYFIENQEKFKKI